MKYTLVYSKYALKDVRLLDYSVAKRIKEKLEEYLKDPLRFAEKLSSPKIGTFRFRVGSYRVIFDIDDDKIVVLRVGHRREIYR